jgi:hypothetical protein
MANYGKRYFWLFLLIVGLVLMSSAGCSDIASSFSVDNATGDLRVSPELAQTYNKAITEPLNKAANEATDPDLAKFTKDLIASYPIGKASEGSQNSDQSAASLVPDMKTITKNASDSVLREAGKNLKDKELSDFYNSFIKSIGVNK